MDKKDIHENDPKEVKCMGISAFENDSNNVLSSQDGQKREECCDGVKDILENQQFPWRYGETKVKGRNLCQLGVTITHIEASYVDPESIMGDTIMIPKVDKFHREIQGAWAKQYCRNAPISLNSEDGSYNLTIPADTSKYEVKSYFKYVPTTIRNKSLRDAEEFFNGPSMNYPSIKEPKDVRTTKANSLYQSLLS